jgi:tetratricopeptide (TPR) repeat protein
MTTVVLSAKNILEAQRDVEAALQIARESGWRSAEAFALTILATCQGSRGDFATALESGNRGLEIAKEIGHRQWMTYAHGVLGMVYADLFAVAAAREHLEQALTLAIETGSWHWIRTMAGFLASLNIFHNELERAQAVLDQVPAPQDPPQTLGQRLVYCARVELALARNEPQRALGIIDQLIASAANAKPDGSNILRVSLLRGQALAALGRFDPAEAALIAARDIADAQGARPMLWRIHATLGKFYHAQGRRPDSDRSFAAARAIVDQLAEDIVDESLRKNFQAGVRGLV